MLYVHVTVVLLLKIKSNEDNVGDWCKITVDAAMKLIKACLRGGVAQWVARLTHNVEVVGSSPIKLPEQQTLPNCLVLVVSRNGIECDFTIELK